MAVRIYTDAELVKLSTLPAAVITKGIKNKSVKEVLLLRRNLLISLSAYSTKHPSRGRLDKVQAGTIWICKQIETTARDAFMRFYFPRLWATEKARGASKLTVKLNLKKKWEDIIKRTGY